MKLLGVLMLGFCFATVASAGELYGTITDADKPVPEGVKVEVVVAGKTFTAATDKFGTYHIFAPEKGKGTLTVQYRNQKPSADVFSYDRATRYNWAVETVEGKLALKRK